MDRVLQAWDWHEEPRLRSGVGGLINTTWVVDGMSGPMGVLQRLNTKVFSPAVHHDIEAVTAHLSACGLNTPRLRRTRAKALWHTAPSGEVWRVLTWVGNRTVDKLREPRLARSAGRLVAMFHSATQSLNWVFRSVRAGFHDTEARMQELGAAQECSREHRHQVAVGQLAEEARRRWSELRQGPGSGIGLPSRIIHGDLKISNVRFEDDTAVALIDLDTLGHGTLDAELGDALRSWCNPSCEDDSSPRFDLDLFEEALIGYVEGGGAASLSLTEQEAIVPGILRITLELAARFAADALLECYFGWDPRFGSRGDHNLIRAEGQLALARAIQAARPEAERLARRVFARPG